MKKCCKCKNYFDLSFYCKDRSSRDGLNPRCKKCESAQHRKSSYKRLYGISSEEYDNLYSLQDGKCWICKSSYEVLCVDHDHKTGKVRSLLCRNCNYNLGRYKEDPIIFQGFIDYILLHKNS